MTQPPANVVPVCYRHPNRETYVRCTRCNQPICPDCMNEASVGFQCPDCVRQGARTQRPAQTAFGGSRAGSAGTVTIALIVVNILAFIATVISSGGTDAVAGGGWGGLLGQQTPLHEGLGMLGAATYPGGGPLHGVAAGEYYRLVTGMFLHFGLLHLALNMWVLWSVGRPLEQTLGRARYFALYMIAGIGGNVAAYAFTAPNVINAGASGAVFGLFGALIVVWRRMRLSVAGIVPVLILNLVLTFSISNISVGGHIGGLITGTLAAIGLAYAPRNHRTLVQVAAFVVLALLLAVLVAWRTTDLIG
ncbi:rhomboid family intramembrane serine protease [Dactylosporangium sp. NPDC048998]|uniref:rhomboid family intramembrane serine protease n=1 Tax=Dactylosporangium sp. NPDC048998 TaxID=3363976 RepID=UPI003722B389